MLRPNNLKCGGKKKKQGGGKIDMSQFYNQPVTYPFQDEQQQGYANKMEEGLAKGILNIQRKDSPTLTDSYDQLQQKTPSNPVNLQQLGIAMRGLRTGLGEVAGRVERGRQNKYDYLQQTALGQMNPMPTNDYQPNPYSLYAKYGGSLKKYQQGGRASIVVNDKNDPRLRAYNDSLILNKATQNQIQKLQNTKTGEDWLKEVNDWEKTFQESAKKAFIRLSDLNGTSPVSQNRLTRTFPNGVIGATGVYKKPVQPVIYKSHVPDGWLPLTKEIAKGNTPDNFDLKDAYYKMENGKPVITYFVKPELPKPLEEKKLQKPIPIYNRKSLVNFSTDSRPTPDAPPEFQVAQFDNTKPTKYSFSYPTGKYNEQKTVYFPDAGTWKQFIGSQRLINSDEGKDYGTATGYMQMGGFPFNGNIRKMKNVTINNYGNQPMLQSPMDDLTSMIGTENPDFMSTLQGMRSMKSGGLQNHNYFGPKFSNGAKMNMGDEDKMDVKVAHMIMSKLLRGFKKGGLTPNKAREILHDGTAQGHPLTDKQRRFFGAKSKGHTNFRGK